MHREGWPDVSVAFRGSDWLGIVSEITDSEVRDYISLLRSKNAHLLATTVNMSDWFFCQTTEQLIGLLSISSDRKLFILLTARMAKVRRKRQQKGSPNSPIN